MARRGSWLAIAAALVCVALPATASAAEFRGKTAQGKPVSIKTNAAGELTRGVWQWGTGDCEKRNLRLKTQSTVLRKAQKSKPGYFKGKGRYKVNFKDAKIRFEVAMDGRQKRANRWKGTFKAEARVDLKRGGKTTCKLRRIDWSAKLR